MIALPRLSAGFFFVSFLSLFMSTTVDFKIISDHAYAGMSQIIPQHEDAKRYLVLEADMNLLGDDTAVIFSDRVGDFISDAAWDNYNAALV